MVFSCCAFFLLSLLQITPLSITKTIILLSSLSTNKTKFIQWCMEVSTTMHFYQTGRYHSLLKTVNLKRGIRQVHEPLTLTVVMQNLIFHFYAKGIHFWELLGRNQIISIHFYCHILITSCQYCYIFICHIYIDGNILWNALHSNLH